MDDTIDVTMDGTLGGPHRRSSSEGCAAVPEAKVGQQQVVEIVQGAQRRRVGHGTAVAESVVRVVRGRIGSEGGGVAAHLIQACA